MLHVERGKNMLPDIVFIGPSGHGLHNHPQGRVVAVGIGKGLPRREDQFGVRKQTDVTLDRIGFIRPGPGNKRWKLSKPTGLLDEHAHCDLSRGLWVGDAEPWDVTLDQRVELDLPSLYQLHHSNSRKSLCDGADEKGSLRR